METSVKFLHSANTPVPIFCTLLGITTLVNSLDPQNALPKGITSIGTAAFGECTNLVKMILPEKLDKIEGWLFIGCLNLQNVVIPEGIKSIGKDRKRTITQFLNAFWKFHFF